MTTADRLALLADEITRRDLLDVVPQADGLEPRVLSDVALLASALALLRAEAAPEPDDALLRAKAEAWLLANVASTRAMGTTAVDTLVAFARALSRG